MLFVTSSMPLPANPSSTIFLLPFLIVFIFLLLQCLGQHNCADEFRWNTVESQRFITFHSSEQYVIITRPN